MEIDPKEIAAGINEYLFRVLDFAWDQYALAPEPAMELYTKNGVRLMPDTPTLKEGSVTIALSPFDEEKDDINEDVVIEFEITIRRVTS